MFDPLLKSFKSRRGDVDIERRLQRDSDPVWRAHGCRVSTSAMMKAATSPLPPTGCTQSTLHNDALWRVASKETTIDK